MDCIIIVIKLYNNGAARLQMDAQWLDCGGCMAAE